MARDSITCEVASAHHLRTRSQWNCMCMGQRRCPSFLSPVLIDIQLLQPFTEPKHWPSRLSSLSFRSDCSAVYEQQSSINPSWLMNAVHHLQALFSPSTTSDAVVNGTSSQKSDSILDDATASKILRSNGSCSAQEYSGPRIDILSKLPYEIATYILIFVDIPTLVNLSLTSQRWGRFATDNEVWRNMYLQQPYWLRPRRQKVDGMLLPINWMRLYRAQTLLDERWATDPVKSRLVGHSDSVYCIHFDGTKIVTGSRDKTIKFWDYHSLQCIDTLEGHTMSVLCLKFNETIMVSGSSDMTVIVWDMKSRKLTHRLVGHTQGVLDVCFNDRYIFSCSKDATIKIWNMETMTLAKTLEGHRGPVNAVQIYEDQIVSASGDGLVKLWDLTSGRCVRDFIGHERGLACVQFDGTRIASGSNDMTIRIWNAATGECNMVLRGHDGLVRTLHFDKNRIVSGSYDNTVKVWDMATGKCTKDLCDGHTSWVFDVHFAASRIIRYFFDLKTHCTLTARVDLSHETCPFLTHPFSLCSSSQDRAIVVWDFGADMDEEARSFETVSGSAKPTEPSTGKISPLFDRQPQEQEREDLRRGRYRRIDVLISGESEK